jgi:hypothetical protein
MWLLEEGVGEVSVQEKGSFQEDWQRESGDNKGESDQASTPVAESSTHPISSFMLVVQVVQLWQRGPK